MPESNDFMDAESVDTTQVAPGEYQRGDAGIKREPNPDSPEAFRALVARWEARVLAAKTHWKSAFDRMREDQKIAFGLQWPGQKRLSDGDQEDRYVANITLRHVQQRVAALYAKNPKVIAKRREQILATTWDGTNQSLQLAQAQVQAMQGTLPMMAEAFQAGDMGGAMGVLQQAMTHMSQLQQAQGVLEDAENVRQQTLQLDKIAKTLELVYAYNVNEQAHDYKIMSKLRVRRAVTTGVGYSKIGFQRIMKPDPDKEARVPDATERLASIKRRAADLADNEIVEDDPEAAELELQTQAAQQEDEIIVREGLVWDWPESTAVIPDPKTINLREFLGADWVAQEHPLSVNEIKEIYEVDVGASYKASARADNGDDANSETIRNFEARVSGEDRKEDDLTGVATVWEIYSKKDGLVYHICEGYPDFLRPPAPPEVFTERFWPWFPLVFNECDAEGEIFPPSDVRIIYDMQQEMNRARQGLREHRVAARPKIYVSGGFLSDDDKEKVQTKEPHAVIELSGLQPGQKIEDLLQHYNGGNIDPNMYETASIYEDMLRTTGNQEANLGGTAGATATETNVAESSRMTAVSSNIDDLDDVLTLEARAGGQILLLNTSEEIVREIVGPGAVWPGLKKSDVAKEVYLEVEAGSTGRPSKTQEIQNAERIFPLLMQIPGISPEFLARELINRLDDRIDLTQAFAANVPSIIAMNAMRGPTGPAGAAQGPEGGANAPKPPSPGGAPGGPTPPGAPGGADAGPPVS